ncbi:hypothetical protein Pan241w_18320 [Gimesia alba]|uniref:Uncharacterized protein n=1 Tax=Gimesia alba TaxID=2527973 RepID=A0A517RD11_9PLAN|nr:hypothetical protein Pan241w_18320 [Gimesia alba]
MCHPEVAVVNFRMQARECVKCRFQTYQTLSKADHDSHQESNSMSRLFSLAHQLLLDATAGFNFAPTREGWFGI